MRAPAWVCTIDESPASAALAAALIAAAPARGGLAVSEGSRPRALARVAQACVRRGTAAVVASERLCVGEHELGVVREPSPGAAKVRLRDGRVELERNGNRSDRKSVV